MLYGVFDRWQSTLDAGVVGNHAVFDRDVKIDTDEDSFSGDVDVFDGFFVHFDPWRERLFHCRCL